jgi:hypothetical protein
MAFWRTGTIAGALLAAMLPFGLLAATPPTRFNCDRACLAKDVKYSETGIDVVVGTLAVRDW